MYKKLLFIFTLTYSIFSFSQEEIKLFNNYLKTSSTGIKEVIPIVNKKNNDILGNYFSEFKEYKLIKFKD